jgi:sulfatase modifying factor 1
MFMLWRPRARRAIISTRIAMHEPISLEPKAPLALESRKGFQYEQERRGGTEGWKYPWGNESGHDKANFSTFETANAREEEEILGKGLSTFIKVIGLSDPTGSTSEVTAFAPNGFALHDMVGNVSQWIADRNGSYPAGPTGPAQGRPRVLRGGSWASLDVRISKRDAADPASFSDTLGFRCVRDAP